LISLSSGVSVNTCGMRVPLVVALVVAAGVCSGSGAVELAGLPDPISAGEHSTEKELLLNVKLPADDRKALLGVIQKYLRERGLPSEVTKHDRAAKDASQLGEVRELGAAAADTGGKVPSDARSAFIDGFAHGKAKCLSKHKHKVPKKKRKGGKKTRKARRLVKEARKLRQKARASLRKKGKPIPASLQKGSLVAKVRSTVPKAARGTKPKSMKKRKGGKKKKRAAVKKSGVKKSGVKYINKQGNSHVRWQCGNTTCTSRLIPKYATGLLKSELAAFANPACKEWARADYISTETGKRNWMHQVNSINNLFVFASSILAPEGVNLPSLECCQALLRAKPICTKKSCPKGAMPKGAFALGKWSYGKGMWNNVTDKACCKLSPNATRVMKFHSERSRMKSGWRKFGFKFGKSKYVKHLVPKCRPHVPMSLMKQWTSPLIAAITKKGGPPKNCKKMKKELSEALGKHIDAFDFDSLNEPKLGDTLASGWGHRPRGGGFFGKVFNMAKKAVGHVTKAIGKIPGVKNAIKGALNMVLVKLPCWLRPVVRKVLKGKMKEAFAALIAGLIPPVMKPTIKPLLKFDFKGAFNAFVTELKTNVKAWRSLARAIRHKLFYPLLVLQRTGGWANYECFLKSYLDAIVEPNFYFPAYDVSCQYQDKTDKRCAKGCGFFHDAKECKSVNGKKWKPPAWLTMKDFSTGHFPFRPCLGNRPQGDYELNKHGQKELAVPWKRGYEKHKGTPTSQGEIGGCDNDDSNFSAMSVLIQKVPMGKKFHVKADSHSGKPVYKGKAVCAFIIDWDFHICSKWRKGCGGSVLRKNIRSRLVVDTPGYRCRKWFSMSDAFWRSVIGFTTTGVSGGEINLRQCFKSGKGEEVSAEADLGEEVAAGRRGGMSSAGSFALQVGGSNRAGNSESLE